MGYIFLRGKGFLNHKWLSKIGRKDNMKVAKLNINGKPVKGDIVAHVRQYNDGQYIDITIDKNKKKEEKEKELREFKNRWRLVMLRHIGSLLKDMADIIETDIICYGHDKVITRKPVEIFTDIQTDRIDYCIVYNDKVYSIHEIFDKAFTEIDKLRGCDVVKMHHIADEIRDIKYSFLPEDKKEKDKQTLKHGRHFFKI